MDYVVPTNDPFVKLGFAKTYGELSDEYNYSQAPKYEADFSEFLCGKRCRERRAARDAKKAADAQKTQSEANLNTAIAGALGQKTEGGMSTGSVILLGVGTLAVIGVIVFFVLRKK